MAIMRNVLAAAILAALSAAAPTHAQTVQLVYANGYARSHIQVGVVADEWIKRIEAATEGRVRIRQVAGGTLLKPENMVEGIRGGVADLGSTVVSFFPGQLPISATLAGTVDITLGNKLDLKGVTAITRRLTEEFQPLSDEFQKLGLRPVYWVPTPAYAIISNKPLQTLNDFRGIKTRAFGTAIPRLLDAAGAVPVALAFGEIYTSLQTGVIDAALTDPPAMITGRFGEVAKNVITTGPKDGAITMVAPVVYFFNEESWKKIPARDQEIIRRISAEMIPYGADRMINAQQAAFSDLAKAGVTVRHLSEADTAEFAKRAPDFLKMAADSINEKGLPGTALVERYKVLADEYISGKWRPF
jgi:TRAP-type C4-dicarboxylate transport system substrate-binding protein